MKKNTAIVLIAVFFQPFLVNGQTIGTYLGDESYFYAQTKQINQFFRRFNCEEDLNGDRLYEGDENFRNPKFRKNYINMLFDHESKLLGDDLKSEFIDEVTSSKNPEFIDFYKDRWFAEVTAKFAYEGKTESAVIFLSLQPERLGYKWVIGNVYFPPFSEMFFLDSANLDKFIHPMSHELDFMNLIKVFKKKDDVEYYFEKDYKPDLKTIFLYEIKKGNLLFSAVTNVRFHFFQLENWYFELSQFNRSNKNSGWLISALTKIPENQKEMLLKYIYYEQ